VGVGIGEGVGLGIGLGDSSAGTVAVAVGGPIVGDGKKAVAEGSACSVAVGVSTSVAVAGAADFSPPLQAPISAEPATSATTTGTQRHRKPI